MAINWALAINLVHWKGEREDCLVFVVVQVLVRRRSASPVDSRLSALFSPVRQADDARLARLSNEPEPSIQLDPLARVILCSTECQSLWRVLPVGFQNGECNGEHETGAINHRGENESRKNFTYIRVMGSEFVLI